MRSRGSSTSGLSVRRTKNFSGAPRCSASKLTWVNVNAKKKESNYNIQVIIYPHHWYEDVSNFDIICLRKNLSPSSAAFTWLNFFVLSAGVQYECNSKIEQGERPPIPGEERSHCRSEWSSQPLRPPPRIPNHPHHLYTHNGNFFNINSVKFRPFWEKMVQNDWNFDPISEKMVQTGRNFGSFCDKVLQNDRNLGPIWVKIIQTARSKKLWVILRDNGTKWPNLQSFWDKMAETFHSEKKWYKMAETSVILRENGRNFGSFWEKMIQNGRNFSHFERKWSKLFILREIGTKWPKLLFSTIKQIVN